MLEGCICGRKGGAILQHGPVREGLGEMGSIQTWGQCRVEEASCSLVILFSVIIKSVERSRDRVHTSGHTTEDAETGES